MREGTRAQGHSAICHARMEELPQGTAKGQQRLEEADRRTRNTAGERAAERIKFQFVDRPFDPASSSSASPSDAIAGGGVMLQVLAVSLQRVSLNMRLKTP